MTKLPDSNLLEQAKKEAEKAARRAYAPYSQFPVGAVVLSKNGEMIPGCNVENGSYPLGNCAERSAMFAAISQGYPKEDLIGLVLYTPTKTLTTPCGACRQVMAELLGPDAFVILTCDDPDLIRTYTVEELLPDSFALS